jgi:hypothetical protein
VPADNVKSPRIPNALAVKWYDTAGTALEALKLDASNVFNVGLQGAAASGGSLALWANGVEKARLLATGALLVGATAAVGAELTLASITGFTPVSSAVIASRASGSASSTATSSIRGYQSEVTTAAASFTAAELTHFNAAGAAKGAGSTITAVYGFKANNALAVGAGNYGFYSDIADAASTYQLYMSGTAKNHINGLVGFGGNPSAGNSVQVLLTPSALASAGSAYGYAAVGVFPSTAAATWGSFLSQLTTPSSGAFTNVIHYRANTLTVAGTATVSGATGFLADAGMGTGAALVYGFRGVLAAASGKYNLFMDGTAQNFLAGAVGIANSSPVSAGGMLVVGGTHQGTAVSGFGSLVALTAPATMTTRFTGFYTTLITTAAAYTVANLEHYYAATTTKGAGSTIGSVYGFRASNGIVNDAAASTTYGFYSDINTAASATAYQLYMAGTAENYILGRLGLGAAAFGNVVLRIGSSSLNTSSSTYGVYASPAILTTSTSSHTTFLAAPQTLASSYTVGVVIAFNASSVTKGAGSAITSVYGFHTSNSIAVGANNYGFYSDIASAATTYQLYMSGTALNFLKGGVILATTAAPTVAAGQIGLGATVATTVGAAGAASALPANPLGYLLINVAGTSAKIPYYNS